MPNFDQRFKMIKTQRKHRIGSIDRGSIENHILVTEGMEEELSKKRDKKATDLNSRHREALHRI